MSNERLRVEFERSGGLAGIPLQVSFNVGDLGPADAQQFRGLLDRAGLPDLGSPANPSTADRFQYDLMVIRDGDRTHVSAVEGEIPANAQRLFDWLVDFGRRRWSSPRSDPPPQGGGR